MSLGTVVDVAIGLILVYLLLGLMTTAFQEILASALKFRATQLRGAIAELVADGDKTSALFQNIFGHVLVSGTSQRSLPSYVSSPNFARALIDILAAGGNAPVFTQVEQAIGQLPSGKLRVALDLFVREAGGDLDAFRSSIATWFDDSMDRLSGQYKRLSQTISIACGVVLAVGLNIDSVHIAQTLWTDGPLRAQIEASAEGIVKTHPDAAEKPLDALKETNAELNGLQLPIGWPPIKAAASGSNSTRSATWSPIDFATNVVLAVWAHLTEHGAAGFLLILIGWAMTAFATSLGAPFWFDTLQNILNLRGAGPKPARADKSGGT